MHPLLKMNASSSAMFLWRHRRSFIDTETKEMIISLRFDSKLLLSCTGVMRFSEFLLNFNMQMESTAARRSRFWKNLLFKNYTVCSRTSSVFLCILYICSLRGFFSNCFIIDFSSSVYCLSTGIFNEVNCRNTRNNCFWVSGQREKWTLIRVSQ